ncbi:MAG: diaminopimelate epimerase [Planctomycetota bacterium]
MTDSRAARSPIWLWQGSGATFAVHDGRSGRAAPDPGGVCTNEGADGFVALAAARTPGAVAALSFFRPDGGAVAECGDGMRCVAAALDPTGTAGMLRFDTPAGLRTARVLSVRDGRARVRVSMGKPRFRPAPADPRAFADLTPDNRPTGDSARPGLASFGPPILVDLGEPHAVFLIDEPPSPDLCRTVGRALQRHPFFQETAGVNVSFAFVHRPDAILLRVDERGGEETAAGGGGACAAVAAAIAVRRCVRRVTVSTPGGELFVDWPAAAEMQLIGPAEPLCRTGAEKKR